jgi:L-malate glycosyltransferase
MKILHIISGDLWGGAESVTYNLCLELSKERENAVSVLLFNHGKLEKLLSKRNISTHVVDETKYSYLQILIKSFTYIRALDPDIIHTHKHKENVLGATLGFILGIPSIRTIHGLIEKKPKIFEIQKIINNFLDWAATYLLQPYIITVSNELSDKIKTTFWKKNIIVINNGIPTEPYGTSDNHLTSFEIHVAIVCRLTHVKRVDIFLEVAKHFCQTQHNNFIFDIYGDGPNLNEINDYIKSNNIDCCIKTHGFVNNIAIALKQTHILLITSEHEGLPINLLEAVFACVPVIAHSVGDIPTVLGHGKYGTLVQRNEPREYIDSIKHYVTDPQSFIEKAMLARSNASKHYTAKIMGELYFNIYQKLVPC